jgi:hypothetical protein
VRRIEEILDGCDVLTKDEQAGTMVKEFTP